MTFTIVYRLHFDVSYVSITAVYFLIRYILRSQTTEMHNRNTLRSELTSQNLAQFRVFHITTNSYTINRSVPLNPIISLNFSMIILSWSHFYKNLILKYSISCSKSGKKVFLHIPPPPPYSLFKTLNYTKKIWTGNEQDYFAKKQNLLTSHTFITLNTPNLYWTLLIYTNDLYQI